MLGLALSASQAAKAEQDGPGGEEGGLGVRV